MLTKMWDNTCMHMTLNIISCLIYRQDNKMYINDVDYNVKAQRQELYFIVGKYLIKSSINSVITLIILKSLKVFESYSVKNVRH